MTTRLRVAILSLAAVILLLAAAGATAGWLFLHGEPAWYRQAGAPGSAGTTESAGAAQQMEWKLIRLYDRVAALHASRVRQAATATRQVKWTSTLPGTAAAAGPLAASARILEQPFDITFTDSELNAFFDKWADTANRRQSMSAVVEDPRLQLRPGEMILAARVKRFHTVISLELTPDLDPNGRLRMNLRRVYGGILPLPEPLWAWERDHLVEMMDEKYAQIRPTVEITPDGTANAAASAAAMNRLLVATLQHQSAEPVLFLPYDLRRLGRTVPTRVQAVHLGDGTLTLTVREMSPGERDALLATMRGIADHPLANAADATEAATLKN